MVQAILIMGGEWMGRVNENLDDLEEDIKSIEIKDGDWQSLGDSEQKHKVRKPLGWSQGVEELNLNHSIASKFRHSTRTF